MNDLRDHLRTLLAGKGAHVDFDSAVKDLPRELRGKRPPGGDHSPWELLEHMRIAQWDILDYIRNPKYAAPKWPDDYWPKSAAPANDAEWDKSIDAYRRDLRDLIDLAKSGDLLAPLPHAKQHTLLRELLLVADHNSYHLGQFVMAAKILQGAA